MKKLLLLFLCSWYFVNAGAQVGSLDPAFGTNGIQIYPVGTVLTAPDNTYYTLGDIGSQDGYNTSYFTLIKHLSSGAVDVSYGTAGSSEPVYSSGNYLLLGIQKDGKVIMVTTVYNQYGAEERRFDQVLFRFDTNGSLDPSFNGTGFSLHSEAWFQSPESLTLNEDIIVVKGSTGYQYTFHYADIFDMSGNPSGRRISNVYFPYSEYDPQASHFNYAVALDQSNIYVSKDVHLYLTNDPFPYDENYIEKLDDPSYGVNGRIADNATVMGAHNGRLVIPSAVYNAGTGNHGFVLRGYNPDGSPDINLNTNGQHIADFAGSSSLTVSSIVFQGERIIVGGTMLNAITGKNEFAIAAYTADGVLDPAFDGDGKQTTGLPDTDLHLVQMTVYGKRLYVIGDYVAAMYILEDEGTPPVTLQCPGGKSVYTDPGVCTAIVEEIGPFTAPSPDDTKVDYVLSGATTGNGIGSVSGLMFNKGVTMVTYSVVGSPAQTCSFNVTVADTEPPIITNASVTPTILWPPNHKMRDVVVNYDFKDNCDGVTISLSVKSNEPQTGRGGGIMQSDWQIINPHLVKLRAERNGLSSGRIYTITINAKDGSGNTGRQTVTVTVPPNQGHHKPSVAAEGERDDLQVKVFANPASNYFTLQTSSNSSERLSLRVVNELGTAIERKNNLPANGQIQIGSSYHSGIYFAEIMQGNQKRMVKLVKLP